MEPSEQTRSVVPVPSAKSVDDSGASFNSEPEANSPFCKLNSAFGTSGNVIVRGWCKNPNDASPTIGRIVELRMCGDGGAIVVLDGGTDRRRRPQAMRLVLSPELVSTLVECRAELDQLRLLSGGAR